jgi:hypothetical protein
MATRAYKRDARGRFAGGGGGAVSTTYGRAGGFAKGNAFGGSRATSRQGGVFKSAATSGRGKNARAGKATLRGRMPDPASPSQYRKNVGRLQSNRKAEQRVARLGAGIALAGVGIAGSGLARGSVRRTLVGSALVEVGIGTARDSNKKVNSLTAQIGAQTRKHNQLKNSTRLGGGHL